MKVKIKHTIYDAESEPVMVILSDADKQNIAKMLPEAHHYCAYPAGMSQAAITSFMNWPTESPGPS